ncbi:MAG: general stress protein [Scytonema sp. PMC 1069.18]|nr:general stress protein [Scytonema sp. PMC 1069.18]MEC4886569.1 general stress protein [Scytonema sp. PMC 1070.18]
MITSVHKRAVGVFSHRQDVEDALHELRNSGFPMDNVSVIKRHADREDDEIAGTQVHERVGNKAEEGATAGAVSGGVLGGLTGLLVGLGTLAIPGIGPIMLAGAAATALATTLAGAGIGAAAGGLLGALIGLGIPEERARVYQERVERGDYLVVIDGTDLEIARAEKILRHRGVEEFDIYDRPETKNVTTNPVTTTPTPVVPNRNLSHTRHAVGYFSNLHDAEAAIDDLRATGFPLSQIFLIHRESPRRERFTGVNVINHIDPTRFRLPETRNTFYNQRVAQGDHVIIVSGTDDDIHRAAAILDRHRIQDWEIHDPTATSSMPLGTHTSTAPMGRTRRAIGVFSHRRDVEAALTELRDAGFPMNQVSLIAKHTDDHTIAGVDERTGVRNLGTGNKADEGAKAGAVTGGALGGLGGLLVGLGTLAIPGVGPVLAGGAAATALATALAGGAIGAAAGGLTGGLIGLGIPENRAKVYNDRVNKGDYLVIVDGTEGEARRAEAILKRHHIEEFDIFDATDKHGILHRNYDQGIHHEAPVVNTTPTEHLADHSTDNPAVTIIDHRNERI